MMLKNNYLDRDDDRDDDRNSSSAIATMVARAIGSIMMMIEEQDVRASERSQRSTRGDSFNCTNQSMRLIAMIRDSESKMIADKKDCAIT